MANGLLLQYVNKRKNDYKHFMGVSSLPSFELISKHISLLMRMRLDGEHGQLIDLIFKVSRIPLKCGKICGNHKLAGQIMSYFTN